jgi:putative peptidoglycan lipid II flippase
MLRVLVVAAVLGPTFLGNAFQSANSVSNVLFELLAAGALSAVLVPTFVELLDRSDQRRAEEVAGRVLGVALALLGAVSLVGVIGAPLLARALTSGSW